MAYYRDRSRLYFFKIQSLVAEEKAGFHGSQSVRFVAGVFRTEVDLGECGLFFG